MGNGFGGGRIAGGGFGGLGFVFRGSSPPWPYVGIGRGGLPRHAYFFGGTTIPTAPWAYQQSSYPFGYALLGQRITPEQELDFLRNQAKWINEQVEQIEKRIHDLESER